MSIPDWLPGCERVQGSDAGPMLPGSKWSLLLHTTEGDSLQGAIAALRAKSAWSHFIFDPGTEQLVQAVSLNRAAKALKSGGNFGRTNAARVIQVEIVGHADDTPTWSPARNAAVGRMIARIAEQVPFRVEMPLPFYGQDAGFIVATASARQRMSWPQWYSFDAICGHQHAPRNDHWDPGHINTAEILAAATGTHPTPPPQPEELTMSDIKAITDRLAAIEAEQKRQGAQLGELHHEYADSIDDKKQGPHGNKAWQIAKTFLAATGRKD